MEGYTKNFQLRITLLFANLFFATFSYGQRIFVLKAEMENYAIYTNLDSGNDVPISKRNLIGFDGRNIDTVYCQNFEEIRYAWLRAGNFILSNPNLNEFELSCEKEAKNKRLGYWSKLNFIEFNNNEFDTDTPNLADELDPREAKDFETPENVSELDVTYKYSHAKDDFVFFSNIDNSETLKISTANFLFDYSRIKLFTCKQYDIPELFLLHIGAIGLMSRKKANNLEKEEDMYAKNHRMGMWIKYDGKKNLKPVIIQAMPEIELPPPPAPDDRSLWQKFWDWWEKLNSNTAGLILVFVGLFATGLAKTMFGGNSSSHSRLDRSRI